MFIYSRVVFILIFDHVSLKDILFSLPVAVTIYYLLVFRISNIRFLSALVYQPLFDALSSLESFRSFTFLCPVGWSLCYPYVHALCV